VTLPAENCDLCIALFIFKHSLTSSVINVIYNLTGELQVEDLKLIQSIIVNAELPEHHRFLVRIRPIY
jgi:hypothetical protein